MNKREKVINILSQYKNHAFGDKDEKVTVSDIIALLKAQEARVIRLEELPCWDGAVYVESRPSDDPKVKSKMLSTVWLYEREDDAILDGIRLINNKGGTLTFPKSTYEKTIRLWTARPTEEQRRVTPWK